MAILYANRLSDLILNSDNCSHLGAKGLKKGALSKFVEDAVKWRLFDLDVKEARQAFADVPTDEIDKIIGDALARMRKKRRH